MMLGLAFDTETSGLPPKGIEKGNPQYPWPAEIGCVLFDMDGNERAVFGSRIRADGRKMQAEATAVHGITDREASMGGVRTLTALAVLCGFAEDASFITGFNVGFDRDVCESSLILLGKDTRALVRPGLTVVDLMRPSTAACKIPSDYADGGYRWPTLDRACQELLGDPPRDGKHKALLDAQRAMRLFLELRRLNYLELAA